MNDDHIGVLLNQALQETFPASDVVAIAVEASAVSVSPHEAGAARFSPDAKLTRAA